MREDGYAGLVLGVTANVLQADVTDFVSCGADSVILKPMSTDKFHAAIAHHKFKRRDLVIETLGILEEKGEEKL